MASMDLRVRLLARVVGTRSIASMSDAQIARAQRVRLGHNPVTDLLFGAVAPRVDLVAGTAAGHEGELTARVYRPQGASGARLPLVVNFHGGGWVLGSLDQADWLCSHVASGVRAVVVSVDYRLAPGHPWPAAPEDCYAALIDLVGRAEDLGADPDRVAVMGDSAGGNLAAVVCQMARDRSGPPIAFQGLVYPATDATFSSASVAENADAPILTREDMVAFRAHYLAGADPREPYVSPLFAHDLTRLPVALVQVAEHDPIRDDGLRYADALRAAGVAVRTTTYVGMPHGFLSFPRVCRSAPQALAELCSELRTALTAHPRG